MEKIIRRVQFAPKPLPTINVAAYARVSSDKDAMLHSLSEQISYYNGYIQKHPGWKFCGVYADEAKTGTKDSRANFQRLLSDCRAGKIDLIITKSISRFARNTVTLLQTARELKDRGIDIFFEEQNLHSNSPEGEFVMTVLASVAQEESRSTSENMKWRIRKNFEEGMPWSGTMLGYRMRDGQLVVDDEEAELVRHIYNLYLTGLGYVAIAKQLNEEGHITRFKNPWNRHSLTKILRNYAYTGNLLLQTTFRENHITKKQLRNNGELPKYHAQNTHEAIIPMSLFEAVREERDRRAEHFKRTSYDPQTYPFSGRIVCACCGKHFRRKATAYRVKWQCLTYDSEGKDACPNGKAIPEEVLYSLVNQVIGCKEFKRSLYEREVDTIIAHDDDRVTFILRDGNKQSFPWEMPSRRKSWTPEMREGARQRTLQRRNSDAPTSTENCNED